MRLSMRLTLAMTTLVLAAVAAIGVLGYYNIERAVVPLGLERVTTQARSRLGALDAFLSSLRADTLASRTLPAHDSIVRALLNDGIDPSSGISAEASRDRLEVIYAGQLRAKPGVRQLRFIGLADGGREIARVDRSGPGNAIRVVPKAELLRKGDEEFFKQAIKLPEREVYVSTIQPNEQNGVLETPPVPVTVLATPVRTANGEPFGIVVLNLDMRTTFNRIRAAVDEDSKIYVVSESGEYLLNPTTGSEPGFDAGQGRRWQDDLPELAKQPSPDQRGVAVIDRVRGKWVAAALAMGPIAGGPRVGVIETEDYATIVAPAASLQNSVITVALSSIIVAIGIAGLLARSLARPLTQMTAAVTGFARNGHLDVPSGLAGEVGVLASAFTDMASEINDKSAALRSKSETLDKTIASMADAVLVIDAAGTTLFANPMCRVLFGAEADHGSVQWQRGYHLFYPDGVTPMPTEETPIGRALRGENFDNVEIAFRRTAETPLSQLVASGRIINGKSGEREGAVIVYRDLTAFRDTERQLRQSQKMEAVGQLTGGVAHDFNNILTVITGTIEILAQGVADRPQLAVITKMIDDAARRGGDLTQQLLSFARKQPLQPTNIDINVLVLETARLLRSTLGEQIEIDTTLDGDPWSALADPSQLGNALINLAVNARDAMPDGGKLTLETKNVVLDEFYAEQNPEAIPGCYVMLAVSDTGMGMAPNIRDRVFDPFFTTKDVGKGTGLGLSMVYGFVKQSEGHIKIYSEEGYGTTIKLYLPRASDADDAANADIENTAPAVHGGGEVLLVVEDDALVRQYVMSTLSSLGYVAHAAASAAEALALVDGGLEFDLLFTDVIMGGGMNGRQLADELKRRRPLTRVLFTSGYTENAIVHHGRLDPGVHLLAKPYRRGELAQMLRLVLGNDATFRDNQIAKAK
jgi:signal transduction histidine kinase/ActR/RegA family two-component response regulator